MQLSAEELTKLNQAITKLHKLLWRKRAFARIKKAIFIDIEKQSQQNLHDIYVRLRHVSNLPQEIRAQINAEKAKLGDVLTTQEYNFLIDLLNEPLLGKYVAPHPASTLKQHSYLYSSLEANKRKIVLPQVQAQIAGEEDMVRLFYTYPYKANALNALGATDILLLDLDEYARNDKIAFNSVWTCNQLNAYFDEHCQASQFKINAQDTTKVFTHFSVAFDPIRRFNHTFIFKGPQGTLTYTLTRAQEISVGRHIKLFHVLRIIEHLRYLDRETRNYVLNHGKDRELIASIFESLFPVGKAQLNAPVALQFKIGHVGYDYQIQTNLLIYPNAVFECIKANDLAKFKQYLQLDIPVHLYKGNFGGYVDISLLNYAVLLKREEMLLLLIEAGADLNNVYYHSKQHGIIPRRALLDAIEQEYLTIIPFLCQGRHKTLKNSNGVVIAACANVIELDLYTVIADHMDVNVLTYLLKHYQIKQSNLNSLLSLAVYYQNTFAILALLKLGANPNATLKLDRPVEHAHIIPTILSTYHTPLTLAAQLGRYIAMLSLLVDKIDVDIPCKTNDNHYAFGKGATALQLAFRMLQSQKYKTLENNTFIRTNCRYQKSKLPIFSDENYQEIIYCLLEKGADPYAVDGQGEQVYLALRTYLNNLTPRPWPHVSGKLKNIFKKIPLDESKVILISPNTDKTYTHRGYALITAYDKQGNLALLLANVKAVDKPILMVPGGEADYTIDNGLVDTVVALTGLQTNLNLTEVAWAERLPRPTCENLIEIYHFTLPNPVEHYSLYQHTPTTNFVQSKREENDSNDDLSDIQFINIKDIRITTIDEGQWSGYPVCRVNNQLIPPFLAPSIAEICGLKQKENIHLLAYELAFPVKLGKEKISLSNLSAIKSFLALGFKECIDLSFLLNAAFEKHRYAILSYLLSQGVRWSERDFNGHFKGNIHDYPENVIQELLIAHEAILTTNEAFAKSANVAGKYGYYALSKYLGKKKPEYLLQVAKSAVAHDNLFFLKYISSRVPANFAEDYCCGFLTNFISHQSLLGSTLVRDILETYEVKKIDAHTLRNLADIYACSARRTVVYEEELSACLSKMRQYLQQHPFRLADVAILHHYINLNEEALLPQNDVSRYKKLMSYAQDYLKLIITVPLIHVLYALKMEDYILLDQLLEKYAEDKCLQNYCLSTNAWEINRKNSQGQTCLQRAVKANAIKSVNFLLTYCFNHFGFSVNEEDANNETLLKFAIKAGFSQIAKLLIANGVVVAEGDIIIARQLQQQDTLRMLEWRWQIDQQNIDERMRRTLDRLKSANNILCLGLPAKNAGEEHILSLAKLLKNTAVPELKNKKIYIVNPDLSSEFNPSLCNVLKAIFPQHAAFCANKTTQELIAAYVNLNAEPELPIQLHLKVDEYLLEPILKKCKYAFIPVLQGANLQTMPIYTALKNACILYSNSGAATPNYLRKNGEYADAMILIEDSRYPHYAEQVIEDMAMRIETENLSIYRSSNKSLNYRTLALALDLFDFYSFANNTQANPFTLFQPFTQQCTGENRELERKLKNTN
jgi:ankyrin repeat protein